MANRIQSLFGGEALLFIDRTTKKVDALFTVIGEGGLERSVEMIELNGGNYQGAVKAESGTPSNSFAANVRQISPGMFKVMENATPSESSADASGYVGSVVDVVGSGLAAKLTPSIITAKKANLPFGTVYLEITSTGKCKAFVAGSLANGPVGWLSEDGAITEEVAIAAEGNVVLEDIGIQFAVASGTTLTVGLKVAVEVRPVNTNGSVSISVGGNGGIVEKGIMIIYPRQTDGSIYRAWIPRVAMQGVGLPMAERAYGEISLAGKPLIDPVENILYRLDYIKAS